MDEMKQIDFEALPTEVFAYVAALRKEAALYRQQRNGARAEAVQLRAELDALLMAARADG